MKNIKYLIASLFVAVSFNGMAQTSLSSYFLDGTLYNYRLNPAMKAERGYFSLLLGNTSFRTRGNVGVSDFLYPTADNKLATFMHSSVDKNEFLSRLPENSRLGFNLDETILSAGFRAFGGYASLGVSLHSSTAVTLPKGLFEFATKGLQNSSYSFGGLNVNTMNYVATTLGYSHEVIKGLRIGANVKYLAGLAHADILVDKLNVELSEQRWMIESHARAQAALFCEANATLDENGIVDGIEVGAISPKASGFGFDFGAVYDMNSIVPGLKFSASVVDLGFINWKYMMKGQSVDTKIEFEGFDEIDYNNMESSVNAEFEKLADDASKMLDLNYDGVASVKTGLNTTMYLGAEYDMPFYKKLSVSLLYGQCFSSFDCHKWYDVRGFVNVAPLKWFEATVNYGYGSYGSSLGWMLNFHPAGVNFFIGSDVMLTKVTPQFIPLNDLNSHITLGLNIVLGSRK